MQPAPTRGLTSAQAAERLARLGPNLLPEHRQAGFLSIFARQFMSPFIYVLLAAALVSYALGQTLNAVFIFAVLMINALIGSTQEFSAQRAAAALIHMVPYHATVLRDGRPVKLNTADIVPGDYVLLVSGDKIPADIHLASAQDLSIDESLLTGESVTSTKDTGILTPPDAPLADQADNCFAGTVVMRGRGEGVVTGTGADTRIGRIAVDIDTTHGAIPPLLQRIRTFTLRITYGILILVALIFLITVLRGDDLATVFLLGVALAVSAIPEGLPAAITVALAIGMQRMARTGVIIRKLVAVESLGSCTFIASDKTGTLTVNEMTVRRILLPDGTGFEVTGEGLDLHGDIIPDDPGREKTQVRLLCEAGALANESRLECLDDKWIHQGDMVDIALLVLANKLGTDHEEIRLKHQELGRIPYESHNAYSASVNRYEGHIELFVKGSVERLLSMCSSAADCPALDHEQITQQVEQLATHGYRVLALGHRRLEHTPGDLQEELHGLEFLGLVAMIDPLRPEAITAVAACRSAGIGVAMVTGDHPRTASALAAELGISPPDSPAVTGQQLAAASSAGDAAFAQLVHSTRVFARVEPHQKKQLVEQYIRDGEFIAVTGDGVNDAPALSHAHVGIAMGMRGTDVARESADLILTDDHFASIVEGIRQGRIVYNNIRKVIFLLISTGAAEITLVLLSLLTGMPLPLFPIQLLWLNLVTNGIQDIALAFEPAEGHELEQQPRPPNEPIFNRLMIERVLVNAVVMGCLAFAVFKWQLDQGSSEQSARNITLLLMVLFENVHVLNSRSETLSIFRQYFFGNKLLLFGMLGAQAIHIGAMYTPGLRDILQVTPVTLPQWGTLLGIALILVVVDELHKALGNIRR